MGRLYRIGFTGRFYRVPIKSIQIELQIPIPNKGIVFCINNSLIMENMDNGFLVPKWVLIVQPKIPQMTQNLSAQYVWDSMKRDFIGRL